MQKQELNRYQIFNGEDYAKKVPYLPKGNPLELSGTTWDAQHLTNFMSRSSYSNWSGDKPNISKNLNIPHKRSFSTKGDHFFRTTKDDKNQSKIGYTPIFPLVSNIPTHQKFQQTFSQFFKPADIEREEDLGMTNRSMKLRCSQKNNFRYQGNAVKFKSTDPITLKHQQPYNLSLSGYNKQRMNRLIQMRHPHGMTGIDHPQNPQTRYYEAYQQKLRIRQEPNSKSTFIIDRDWKTKGRIAPFSDNYKQHKITTIRRFRNDNTHGYNILTNRMQ